MSTQTTLQNSSLLREYYELTKPRVVMLIVFTAIIGMFLAVPGIPPLDKVFFATLGLTLQAASAAAINQIIDREVDARMMRTCGRPLVTGNLSVTAGITFAVILGLSGFAILWIWVNPLTALLTQLGLVGYAGIYTLYLKRASPQNIVIGGAAGAIPPVIGWAAISGTIHPHALILFSIIFVWTPPHYWPLAIARKAEYAEAGIPMLPVTHGNNYTRTQILLYTFLLFAVCLLPAATGMSGMVYLFGAVVLGSIFIWFAWQLKFKPDANFEMKTFAFSIIYLMGIFSLLLADHYLVDPL